LELARGLVRELFPNSFSISFYQAAHWRRFCDLRNNVAFCQSAAREKEIEKKFGNNCGTSPLASSKRLDSGDKVTGGQSDREKVIYRYRNIDSCLTDTSIFCPVFFKAIFKL
jgi:hypothetical protein